MNASITNVYGFQGMEPREMRKAWHALSIANHPDTNPDDRAGATERMKVINAEFSYWQAESQRDYVYKAKVNENPGKESYYRDTYYSATFVHDYASAIEFLINNGIFTGPNFEVEICGIFLWIYGVGKEDVKIHELLRGAGFRGKAGKYHEDHGKYVYAWYFTPKYRAVHTNATVNQQRNKYGQHVIYGRNGLASGD